MQVKEDKTAGSSQNKHLEINFFDSFADSAEYTPFEPESSERLVDLCIKGSGMKPGMVVADLGCGSGVFSRLLKDKGFNSFGVDLSQELLMASYQRDSAVPFVRGDIETLPIKSDSLDAVFLAGVIHHFPDLNACAEEVFRVLKPGGVFAAFDPNRMNPVMWLYRDHSSPFYSPVGVTPNERPILAETVQDILRAKGFETEFSFVSGLRYQYVESKLARLFLPIYNTLDSMLFTNKLLNKFGSFVITCGVKPGNSVNESGADKSKDLSAGKPISEDLLKILKCPVTDQSLSIEESGSDNSDCFLISEDGSQRYSVRGGVPDLVPYLQS